MQLLLLYIFVELVLSVKSIFQILSFRIQILLSFYSTFSNFVSGFLNHSKIIFQKINYFGIHNFSKNRKSKRENLSFFK
jgi:Na+/H+ antiporter NhaB